MVESACSVHVDCRLCDREDREGVIGGRRSELGPDCRHKKMDPPKPVQTFTCIGAINLWLISLCALMASPHSL